MSIEDLIQQLSDPDENERIFAADDLGMYKDSAAVEPLFARLGVESCRAVREMILLALRSIQLDEVLDHAAALLVSDDPFLRNEMAALLESRGEYAIPWLYNLLQHPDPDARKLALEAGLRIPGESLKAFLEAGLQDSDSNVVMSAVESLGSADIVGFRRRLEAIANADLSPMLTLACIEALGKLEDWDGLDAFLAKFGDRPELRYSLIGAVGTSGQSRHLLYLEANAENPILRQEVVNALLNLCQRNKFTELGPEWLALIASWVQGDPSISLQQDGLRLLRRLTHQPAALALAEQLASGAHRDE
jgi:HEAT repeat protein